VADQSHEVAFREVQKHRQVWVWLIVFGAALLMWYALVQQIILGQPFGTKPGPDWMIWLFWLLIGIGLPLLFLYMKLIVEVGDDGVHIRYVPFVSRLIPFEEIEGHEARSYKPIREYGGWGIRWWGGQRRAYNVSGDQGVELKLRSGDRIMIGSQRADALAEAISAGIRGSP
jgi:hypothetical protein